MSKRSGYLILEIALVVACIIVLVSIGLPRMQLFERRIIHYELAVMRQFFMASAQRALATGAQQTIILDPAHNRYSCNGFVQQLAHGVCFGLAQQVTVAPSEDGSPLIATTFTNNQIICYPNGTLQAGTLYLTNAQGTECGCITIPVGMYLHIRSYGYTNGRWKRIE